MHQEQRAQVWARKIELKDSLNHLEIEDNKVWESIEKQIEQCNQALIQNKFELMPQPESEADN